jgi:hypothetical protein
MDIMNQLKELQKQQRKLEGEMSKITHKAEELKKGVAVEAATDLIKNLKALGAEFYKGKVSDLWGKVMENMNTLNQNDEKFFSSFSSQKNPYNLKFADQDEQRFIINLIGNSLMKEPTFSKFLGYLGSKNRPGNFFFRGES